MGFCEWTETLNDPEKRRAFEQFANSEENREPAVEKVEERGQSRPAYWPKESAHDDFKGTRVCPSPRSRRKSAMMAGCISSFLRCRRWTMCLERANGWSSPTRPRIRLRVSTKSWACRKVCDRRGQWARCQGPETSRRGRFV